MSIFACVIEDTTPPVLTVSKINCSPISFSPEQLKKRFENNNDLNNSDGITSTNDSTPTPIVSIILVALNLFRN